MTAIQVIVVGVGLLLALVVTAYLIVRAGSLGYFRTRNEYERRDSRSEEAANRWLAKERRRIIEERKAKETRDGL